MDLFLYNLSNKFDWLSIEPNALGIYYLKVLKQSFYKF